MVFGGVYVRVIDFIKKDPPFALFYKGFKSLNFEESFLDWKDELNRLFGVFMIDFAFLLVCSGMDEG